jgi:hypothetical protein
MSRLLLMICLACVACEDDGPLDSDKDMATGPNMTVDLTVAEGCAAAVQCSMQCPVANVAQCTTACFSMVSAAGLPFAQALQGCIQMKCTSLGGDMGSAACDDPGSQACNSCVQTKCLAEATACLQH